MPFRPELHYFFLYLKQHLEQRHKGLLVERGDSRVLTKAIVEKIRASIESAQVVIADITGGNPSVFYEIGLAHARNKPVIFLTQDQPEKAPVDLRQFEFIHYDLGHHEEFLSRLDNAIQNVFAADYAPLFQEAGELLREFNRATGSASPNASMEEFQVRVMRGEYTGGIPDTDQRALRAEFLLLKIAADPSDPALLKKITAWITAA